MAGDYRVVELPTKLVFTWAWEEPNPISGAAVACLIVMFPLAASWHLVPLRFTTLRAAAVTAPT